MEGTQTSITLWILLSLHLIFVANAEFDISDFDRSEETVCVGETLTLDCPKGHLLWVHGGYFGASPFTFHSSDDGKPLCVDGDDDCWENYPDTAIIYRATSTRPHSVRPGGKINCLFNAIYVNVSYMFVCYSCIPDAVLNSMNMLSATMRVASAVHIQIPVLSEDRDETGSKAMCHVSPNDSQNDLALSITLVYADLPSALSCSQELWLENQDNIKVFSLCSPYWLRQYVMFEGEVNWVTLHFRAQPQLNRKKRALGDEHQKPPSLFIWIYIQAKVTFTVTCGDQPTSQTTAHTGPISWTTTNRPPVFRPTALPSHTPQSQDPTPTAKNPHGVESVTLDQTSSTSSPVTHSSIRPSDTKQTLGPGIPTTASASNAPISDAFTATKDTGNWDIVATCIGSVAITMVLFGMGIVAFIWRSARRRTLARREHEMPYYPHAFQSTQPNPWLNSHTGLASASIVSGRGMDEERLPEPPPAGGSEDGDVGTAGSDETLSNVSESSYASLRF